MKFVGRKEELNKVFNLNFMFNEVIFKFSNINVELLSIYIIFCKKGN